MTTPRITQRLLVDRSLATLQGSLGRLAAVQEQVATGKLVNRPSDSPTDTAALMKNRQALREVEQHGRNAADGGDRLAQTDAVLRTSMDALRRAQELALQGASSGATGQQAREALATEVDQIRQGLVAQANTQRLGRPLFGGTTGLPTAYDASGTYVGDRVAVQRTVADGEQVRVDVAGPEAFGDGETSVFADLARLSANLRGNPGAISGDVAALESARQRLAGATTDAGARAARLEKVTDVAASRKIDLQAQISDIEDIDFAEAATELGLREMAYQAALGSTARVLQPSLLDFLR
ncbi:MAG: flagellin [Nocardioidaceae bacterium]|nr:flagellin [Nocardioidaceae bacterium]